MIKQIPNPQCLLRDDVCLVPLEPAHEADLRRAAADGALWNLVVTSVPEPDQTAAYINNALSSPQTGAGSRIPFAVLHQPSGRAIGSTSYHDIIPETGRLDIGYTWYAKSFQRTAINTVCKILLLEYAFETLEYSLVGWRVDSLNIVS